MSDFERKREMWGLCSLMEADIELFFPSTPGDSGEEAKEICGECELREECLEYAIEHKIDHGFWGATSGIERVQIRKERKAAASLTVEAAQQPVDE